MCIFIFGLVCSGVTAIPIETELKYFTRLSVGESGMARWLVQTRDAFIETNAKYPFIAYGTDWLAFAHFVIAVAFVGPLRNPVKNIWVVEFGMIACVLVIPFSLVMGSIREIPFVWRLIDCSFGVLGIVPLWLCWRLIKQLEEVKR